MLNEAVCATINSVAEHSTVDVDISTHVDGTFELKVRNNTRRTGEMAVPQAHPSTEEERAGEENEDEAQSNAETSDQAIAPLSQPPNGIDVDAALQRAMGNASDHEGLLSVSVSVERSEVRADGTVVTYSKSTSMQLEQTNRSEAALLRATGDCAVHSKKEGIVKELVPVNKRVKGDVFIINGVHKKWNGSSLCTLCRDCPTDNKTHAAYPDERGKLNKLCGPCSRKVGSYTVRNPCRDCPADNKTYASYPDECGNLKKLCGPCSHKAGSHTVRNPCRDCPADNKTEACYPDELGNLNKLCGPCSRKVGSYTVLHPCRDCPADNKTYASYPDECGNLKKLCGPCSRKVGSYTFLYPCRDCPADNKKEANYPDECGNRRKLCGPCSHKVGSYTVLNPCRDCPTDNKMQACYPDEFGNLNKLCGPCSRKAGSHTVLHPCRDCPVDNKTEASYPDECGKLSKLCSQCAITAGTHVDTGANHGASYEACRCFDLLEAVMGIHLPHVHFLKGGGREGREKSGLLAMHPNMRPDAFRPDPSGKCKGFVYQYHGVPPHGWLPSHPKHSTYTPVLGKWGPTAYAETVEKDRRYIAEGYRVFVIWGHEFTEEVERKTNPRDIREVCREFLG